jgi:DNA helicase-2/ATP-dependent DNA helicase PcrA
LIGHNRTRHEKVLRAARAGGVQPRIMQCQDETDEARTVIDDIRRRLAEGVAQPRDFAILFRTNEQPRVFELELRRAKLPYVLVGGMSFYDRKEVRDILAYLKLLSSPDDEVSLRRIINAPARGIGPRAVEALLAEALARRSSMAAILPRVRELSTINASTVEAIEKFRHTIEQARSRLERTSLVDTATQLVREINYQSEINRQYHDPNDQQSRWAAVEEVINSLGAYEKRARRPTLAGFLDEILLGDRDNDRQKDEQLERNAIALMTLHSAKGLEFPQVYLVGLEEGLLPHRRAVDAGHAAIDEERRLCYVGITRARDILTISLALARTKWGKLRPTVPSPFLYEIVGQSAGKPKRRRADSAKSKKTAATPSARRRRST